MIEMVKEYKKSLQDAKRMYKTYDHDELTLQEESDKKIIAAMIRDLEFTIQWLETGRNPDLRRGIDKVGVYSMDPQLLDRMQFETISTPNREISIEDRDRINNALAGLTQGQRDAFFMVRVEGISFRKCADLMGVKKGSVQSFVERAREKIDRNIQEKIRA